MDGLAQFALHLVTLLCGAAAVYGGIRSDIRHLTATIERTEGTLSEHLNQHLKGEL